MTSSRTLNKWMTRNNLLPGLDYIAGFINSFDTEGMSGAEVRKVIFKECMEPGSYYGSKLPKSPS